MAFWTQNDFDPKRNFAYRVSFGDPDLQQMSFAAKSCTKPKLSQTEVTWAYLNYEFHYPGRVQHDVITLVTANLALDVDSAYAVSKLFENSGYEIPGDRNSFVTIGKQKATQALGNMDIIQMDSDGKSLEKWRLKNVWLKDFNPSDGDYENDDIATIEMVFRYDFAELEVLAGSGAKRKLFVPTSRNSAGLSV